VNRRKPRVQTPVVSRYPAPAPINDFVLLFLPSCGPHLIPLATGSLESAYLSLHSSEAPQGIDLSHPLFTCTNANQAATCTCNTQPRVSPHHVVNHSSQPGETIHRSSDATVLSLAATLSASPHNTGCTPALGGGATEPQVCPGSTCAPRKVRRTGIRFLFAKTLTGLLCGFWPIKAHWSP
jgi:hypothetical protein